MIRAFIPESIPGLRKPLFLEALPDNASRMFQTIPTEEFAGIIEKASTINGADYAIAPHEYADLLKHKAYFARIRGQARDAGKRLIVSAYQDNSEPIQLTNAIILRPFAYKSRMNPNEIAIAPYLEDIGRIYGSTHHEKGERPSIGFVGRASFTGSREAVRYLFWNYVLVHDTRRDGLYFRRHAINVLCRDSRFDFRLRIRSHFSANKKTVELSPEQARKEYIDALKDSLFNLTPRGDSNGSFRFFETLSAGRIPVLIDTDIPLPLEDRIRYDDFIVRVPMGEMHQLGDIVYETWRDRTDDDLQRMQRDARATYEQYLYAPAYYRTIFTPQFLATIPNV